MRPIVFVVPGSIATRTGGYEYDRRMAAGLRARGRRIDVLELDGSFPFPTVATLDAAGLALASIPDGTTVIVDGLALGAMPEQVERETSRLHIVALVHMPLADDSGLAADAALRLQESERRAVAAAALVVATGEATAHTLRRLGVPHERLAIVEPGTDRAPLARGSGNPSIVHLVCVATVGPGKGHVLLVDALAGLPAGSWRLTCAGSLDRHPQTTEAMRARVRARGLEDRVSLAGELDRAALAALYDSADAFVLPTLHESYGMAVAEAIAHGLPVVSTITGAIPALVDDDAGLLVPPGDGPAFARALASVIGDASLRAALAAGARRERSRLRSWESAIDEMQATLTVT